MGIQPKCKQSAMAPFPSMSSGVQVMEVGEPGTASFRLVYLDLENHGISPWCHIPLYNRDGDIHVISTATRGVACQMEISWGEVWCPLRQAFSHCKKPVSFRESPEWNMGILPQTLADEEDVDGLNGGLPGDSSPLEVIDIGSECRALGEVYAVKPLSAFAVLNPGTFQISWKVIGVATNDPIAATLNDVNDVAKKFPGLLEKIREWLRRCPFTASENFHENLFGHNERAQDLEKVLWVIDAAHSCWQTQNLREPPFERLKFDKSPYEPKNWARKFGVRSFSESSSSDTSVPSSAESSHDGKFVPSRPSRPAYFEPKGVTEYVSVASEVKTPSRSSWDCLQEAPVLETPDQQDMYQARGGMDGERTSVPLSRTSVSEGSGTGGSEDALLPFVQRRQSIPAQASMSECSSNDDSLVEKRVRWAEFVEVWEIPGRVDPEGNVVNASLCRAPETKKPQRKPSNLGAGLAVSSEQGAANQVAGGAKRPLSRRKILRTFTGCVSVGSQVR